MKKYLNLFCILFAAALLFSGCEKEEEYVPDPVPPRLNGEGYMLQDNENFDLNCYYLQRMGNFTWKLQIVNEEIGSMFACIFWSEETQIGGTYNFINREQDLGISWNVLGSFKRNNDEESNSITAGTMKLYRKTVEERDVYRIEIDASSPQHSYKMEFTARPSSYLGFPEGKLY
jgi:hypothetical protein